MLSPQERFSLRVISSVFHSVDALCTDRVGRPFNDFITYGFWNLSGLLNLCVCVLCACVCVCQLTLLRRSGRRLAGLSVDPSLPFLSFFSWRQDGGSVHRESRRISGGSWWAPCGPLRPPQIVLKYAERERKKWFSRISRVQICIKRKADVVLNRKKGKMNNVYNDAEDLKKKDVFIHVQISSIQNKSLWLLSVVRLFFF